MTEQGPQVSVVVPVYNAERTIGGVVESLLALRYPIDRRELIFVDNGSTDATATILASHQERIRVLNEPRRSRSRARNLGIHEARHPVVAFTDADCIVEPGWLHRLVAPLDDAQVGISGGAIRAARPCTLIEQFGEEVHDQERAINLYVPPYTDTANWASRRSVLLQVGGFDAGLWRAEDVDLAFRIVQAGYRITYQPDAIVYHRNPRDLSGLFQEGLMHGFYSVPVLKKHRVFIEQHGHRSFRFIRYRMVAEKLIRLARRNSDPHTLCEATFSTGKTLGKMIGSLRFRHWAS